MSLLRVAFIFKKKYIKAMRKRHFIFYMAFLFSCQNQDDHALKIFAAASLATALPQVGFVFETQYPGTKLELNFAASSTLAKQIAQGANADLYIPANPQWADFLQDKQLLQSDSRFSLLSNKLVCIVPEGHQAPASLNELLESDIKKIAVGDWTHVPLGIYTKAVFEKAGLWHKIESKLIPTVDARAALIYVADKQVECGIVYRSDAMASPKIEIAFELPNSLQPKIHYPAAIIAGSQKPFLDEFISFLKSEKAKRIFRNNGFTVIQQEKIH